MAEITQNWADFDGNDLLISGNSCFGRGARCTLRGDRIHILDADGAVVYGKGCAVWCDDPSTIRVYGGRTTVNGKLYKKPPPDGRCAGTVRKHDRERDRDVISAPGGIAASRAVACSVHNANAGGGTFTGGNISVGGRSVVVIDDDAPPANITSVRGGSVRVVASSSERQPRRRLPRGHTCIRASEGEHACAVCMDNRVDAVLQPCGHANLCVDCAATLYRTKAPCPICNRKISSVVAAFFGGITT